LELEINGSICSDSAEILSKFADHFFQKEKPSNQEHINIEETVRTFIQSPPADAHAVISNIEIISAAEAIKKKSAPGLDGLSIQLILICFNS
jgi:hypothetical protein